MRIKNFKEYIREKQVEYIDLKISNDSYRNSSKLLELKALQLENDLMIIAKRNKELSDELEILKKKNNELDKELVSERADKEQTIESNMSTFRRRLPKCCVCHEDVVEIREDVNDRNLTVMNCGHWACKTCLDINLYISPDCPLCKCRITRQRSLFI